MIHVETEFTPNPNALKFVLDRDVLHEGKLTFRTPAEAEQSSLAKLIFALGEVEQVHFFENVITVSKTEFSDWGFLENDIIRVVQENFDTHDPAMKEAAGAERPALTGDLQKIDDILDRTVRPFLQGDGGDLQVISLEGNTLKIHYQGACGSCPSSTAGTLEAIKEMLREEFNPDIEVETIEA